jgi:hypothetical protein
MLWYLVVASRIYLHADFTFCTHTTCIEERKPRELRYKHCRVAGEQFLNHERGHRYKEKTAGSYVERWVSKLPWEITAICTSLSIWRAPRCPCYHHVAHSSSLSFMVVRTSHVASTRNVKRAMFNFCNIDFTTTSSRNGKQRHGLRIHIH